MYQMTIIISIDNVSLSLINNIYGMHRHHNDNMITLIHYNMISINNVYSLYQYVSYTHDQKHIYIIFPRSFPR